MLSFRLRSGRSVTVNGLHVGRTYACLLEGRPGARLNDQIVRAAVEQATKVFRKERVHLLPPQANMADPDHPVLPKGVWFADLVCHEPLDPKFMASALIVVWFAPFDWTRALPELLREHLGFLPWDSVARDFDY